MNYFDTISRVIIANGVKSFSSKEMNYTFNLKTGYTELWGRTIDDDPIMSPYGPMIADIEVTTICEGIAPVDGLNPVPCKFCYKSNTSKGINMSFETFKMIIDKLPKTLTQVALGADAQCKSNPEIWNMMQYCRDNNIIPNITVADVDKETAKKLGSVCGAVAVSSYDNRYVLVRSLKNLHEHVLDKTMPLEQVNIHQMASKETLPNLMNLLENFEEIREYVNAVVFLSLKQRGRGKSYNRLSREEFGNIIKYCLEKNIPFGFDSCSAIKVANAYKDIDKNPPLHLIESCESTAFSCFFNAHGKFYPCSFNEEEKYAIDIKDVNNFFQDLWFSEKTQMFRKSLLCTRNEDGLCSCPSYEV